MTRYIIDGLANTARRVHRAIQGRALVLLSDHYMTLSAHYLAATHEIDTLAARQQATGELLKLRGGTLRTAFKEIEILRSKLQEIVDVTGAVGVPNGTTRKVARIAKAALQPIVVFDDQASATISSIIGQPATAAKCES